MIELNESNGKVTVTAPYNEQWKKAAKMLGGKWNSVARGWAFDERDRPNVEASLTSIFGWVQPSSTDDIVTLELTVGDAGVNADQGPIVLAGMRIAGAFGRDTGAKLNDGVTVVSGWVDSGGSRKNWTTVAKAGTVFRIRDIPRTLAEAMIRDAESANSKWSTYWSGSEIVDEVKADRTALEVERERLVARLAEIDKALGTA